MSSETINPEALLAGISTARDKQERGGYAPLVQACATIFHEGKRTKSPDKLRRVLATLHVPGLQYLIDATYGTLGHKDMELPMEAHPRAVLAIQILGMHVATVLETSDLQRLYSTDEHTRPIPAHRLTGLENATYLTNYASGPFVDAKVIGGGALRALRQAETPGDHATIIANSTRLTSFSNVTIDASASIYQLFGEPYATADLFEVVPPYRPGDLPHVNYTPTTQAHLNSLTTKHSGCPTMQLSTNEGSVLATGWREAVSYLFPNYVTLDLPQKTLPQLSCS